jgi:hypothetical protein
VLTKRAVEKHINSIFTKLGLADAQDVSKRVKGYAAVPVRHLAARVVVRAYRATPVAALAGARAP